MVYHRSSTWSGLPSLQGVWGVGRWEGSMRVDDVGHWTWEVRGVPVLYQPGRRRSHFCQLVLLSLLCL